MLLITAKTDVFRDAAEDFARRLMAADHEIWAIRALGAIHDFIWLPELRDAQPTHVAQVIAVQAIRLRYERPFVAAEGC